MAAIVYILCAATALICCILLLRGYWQSGVRLLLWSSFCFAMFTLDNLLLFVDRVVIPATDLSFWRMPVALIGVIFLLYGMIWEAK